MNKNKKIIVAVLVSTLLSSIIIFIGLFSYNKNISVPKVENENITDNTILLANSIIKTDRLNEIVETKKINNYIRNYFSTYLFELNIFSIIRESFKYLDENKIQISNFTQKIEYNISDDRRKIYCRVFFIHKKNNNLFYKSDLKFYILSI
ncbi:MAG: hypothetical protein RSA40_00600 [Malacoplasma sp.]